MLLALLAVAGCDSGSDSGGSFEGDAHAILENEARSVLQATYQNLAVEADTLQARIDTFAAVPLGADSINAAREDALAAARAAWRNVHRPWAQSAPLRLDRVAGTPGVEAALDAWPADAEGIQAVTGGSVPITAERVAAFDGGTPARKGLHAIEFLLFGAGEEKPPAAFTPREQDYLAAAATALAERTQALLGAWSGNDGAAAALANAGRDGSGYATPQAALDTLAQGLALVAGSVGTRLGVALADSSGTGPLRRYVESARSESALLDLRNALRGVRHVYTGDYDGRKGPGFDEIARDVRPALDEKIRRRIARAITRLNDLRDRPGSLRAAREDEQEGREKLRAAREAALALHETLRRDLASVVDGLSL
jgi:predicted lipoprotein